MIDHGAIPSPAALDLTPTQSAVISAGDSTFLFGPAGTGKSTALQHRLHRLLAAGEQSYTILVLVSETDHIARMANAVRDPDLGPQSELKIVTYSAFAREMISLLWPLIARQAGFTGAHHPPTFLSYDLAQLLMWRLIKPSMDGGMFASLRLRPQQIVSQILDTLNRAALNNLTLEEAEKRQLEAWTGEREQILHLKDASSTAKRFRAHCLENNLLDLSLIIQVFNRYLVDHPELRRYFSERFRHLIVDNLEEQTPAGQNFIKSLIGVIDTASVAFDREGGYKRFLSADPDRAMTISDMCRHIYEFKQSFTATKPLLHLSNQVTNFLTKMNHSTQEAPEAISAVITGRYRREMVVAVVDHIYDLLQKDTKPDEIAVITPYLDGALRYSISSRMRDAGIPYRLTRRRSIPREEPRVRAWITWLALAHPSWDYHPSPYDVAEALHLSVSNLDPARAQLVAESLYNQESITLLPTTQLQEPVRLRLGGNRIDLVEELRIWLEENGEGKHTIDGFLSRLFNGLLALPRYKPEPDLVGAAVCDWLVRSAGQLRRSSDAMGMDNPEEAGAAFIDAIYQGLVSASPPDLGHPPDPQGVTISTMYGYLLSGQPVEWQVWLDVGTSGWWDIPRQPLSNAFVLTQQWQVGQPWTANDDFAIRNELLSRIMQGLVRRCKKGVILATSDLDRRGFRQEGSLLRALQPLL